MRIRNFVSLNCLTLSKLGTVILSIRIIRFIFTNIESCDTCVKSVQVKIKRQTEALDSLSQFVKYTLRPASNSLFVRDR